MVVLGGGLTDVVVSREVEVVEGATAETCGGEGPSLPVHLHRHPLSASRPDTTTVTITTTLYSTAASPPAIFHILGYITAGITIMLQKLII